MDEFEEYLNNYLDKHPVGEELRHYVEDLIANEEKEIPEHEREMFRRFRLTDLAGGDVTKTDYFNYGGAFCAISPGFLKRNTPLTGPIPPET